MSPRRNHDNPRDAILKAARALVLKDGHERLSLRAIARRAGYSPASLYEHFDDREAIVRALADDANAALRGALSDGAVRSGDPVKRIVEIGLAYIEFARTRREDFLLLFSRLPSKRRSRGDDVAAASPFGVLAAAIDVVVERSQRDELAYAVWAAAHGMAMLQATHLAGFDADFPRTDRAALEALVRGWGLGLR